MKKRLRAFAFLAAAAALFAGVGLHMDKAASAQVRCIVIDPGHGGFDGGAVEQNGLVESELNLAVALEMENIFSENGYRVVLTREDTSAVGADKSADMQRRAQIISAEHPDLVISVHMNRFSMDSVKGPQVFYQKGAEGSSVLADCLQERLNEAVPDGWKKRDSKAENFYILKVGPQPSVLIECGFISNPEEAKLLQDNEYRRRLAQAIFSGTQDYFANNAAQGKSNGKTNGRTNDDNGKSGQPAGNGDVGRAVCAGSRAGAPGKRSGACLYRGHGVRSDRKDLSVLAL